MVSHIAARSGELFTGGARSRSRYCPHEAGEWSVPPRVGGSSSAGVKDDRTQTSDHPGDDEMRMKVILRKLSVQQPGCDLGAYAKLASPYAALTSDAGL